MYQLYLLPLSLPLFSLPPSPSPYFPFSSPLSPSLSPLPTGCSCDHQCEIRDRRGGGHYPGQSVQSFRSAPAHLLVPSLASFPDLTQLSVTYSTEKRAFRLHVGRARNKATLPQYRRISNNSYTPLFQEKMVIYVL